MKDYKLKTLTFIIGRLITKIQYIDKKPKKHGTDDYLTFYEIHYIEPIGEIENILMTQLADYFWITRGTVSQIVKKLKNKGYLETVKSKNNDKENKLLLT